MDNTVSFIFTPATPLSYENGQFVIEAPVWASVFDSESKEMIDIYPFMMLGECAAEQFNSIT